MSKFIFKDLKRKEIIQIQSISSYNLKQVMKAEVVDGSEKTFFELSNPQQAQENSKRIESFLMETFFTKENCGVENIDLENITDNEYNNYKQDLLDWATDNKIIWIIKLKLCPLHTAIAELIEENPHLTNFREKTLKEMISKWEKQGDIEAKMLEKIKEKDKKKLVKT